MALRNVTSGLNGLAAFRGVASTAPALEAVRSFAEDAVNYCRQSKLMPLGNRIPFVSDDAYVSPTAVVAGDVDIHTKASVMSGCVLRGDLNNVRIDSGAVVQENVVVHSARTSPTGLSAATVVGKHATVGAGCVLRSTRIGDFAVVGERSTLCEGSVVSAYAMLGAGSVVPPGRLVPGKQLWAGNPAAYVRDLTKDEVEGLGSFAEAAGAASAALKADELPVGTAWRGLPTPEE